MKTIRLQDKHQQLVALKDKVPNVMNIIQVRMDKYGNQKGMIEGTRQRVILKKSDASRVWREAV